MFNYAQDTILPLPLAVGSVIDTANNTFIVGLGQVVERCKIALDDTTQATQ
jgi:hypothetical protein